MRRLAIHGCDDTTEIPADRFTDAELDVLRKLCRLSHEFSNHSCQPTVSIERGEERMNVPKTYTYTHWEPEEDFAT